MAYQTVVCGVRLKSITTDGIATLSEIKKLNPGIEVILLTGYASVDSAVDGMRMGAYDYLLKPCDIEVLMEKLESAYELKSSRDERLRQAEIRRLMDRSPS